MFVNLDNQYYVFDNQLKISTLLSKDKDFGFASEQELRGYVGYTYKDVKFYFAEKSKHRFTITKEIFAIRIIYCTTGDVSLQILELIKLYDLNIIYTDRQ